jgi:hypothetical protein
LPSTVSSSKIKRGATSLAATTYSSKNLDATRSAPTTSVAKLRGPSVVSSRVLIPITHTAKSFPSPDDYRLHSVPFDQEIRCPPWLTRPCIPKDGITMSLPDMWPLLVWPNSLVMVTLLPCDTLMYVGLPS